MEPDSEHKDLLNAIMEAADDAIVVSDAKGTILQANAAAGQLFGYDLENMLGQNVKILMPDEMAARHDGFMAHQVATGEQKVIGVGRDVEGMRKDGSVFPLHLSVGRSESESGAPLFAALLHDLSEQQATQSALARSQRLDAIGQMTGGIAHDFNNLLTVILGNLELLEMRITDERHLKLIRDGLEATEMGTDLTQRLMVFARRSNLKPVNVDLREVCEDTLSILKRTLGAAHRITTEYAPEIDQVTLDPVQLQSALMNLALNARDAMGEAGELLISVENVTIDDSYIAQETNIEQGDYVRLSISDDGDGMSKEAQKRAFEPFFTTKSDVGGTGLGLAMVYGFVRQSGGHITIYSEPGYGTSFGLYFPVSVTTDHLDTDDPTRERPLKPIVGEKTVLVVEDNPKVRELSVARLQNLGFQTMEAENGDAAYALLKSGSKIDLVFSDLVMPGKLNGYGLAAKARLEFPSVKILLTSGYASDVVTGRMSDGQNYEILHKPYRILQLSKRIQALFSDADTD